MKHGAIGNWLAEKFGVASAEKYTETLINRGDCRIALDIGCGISSPLTRFRPRIRTVGVDAYSINEAKQHNVHDYYIEADVCSLTPSEMLDRIEDATGSREVDLITSYHMIEHLPKSEGWKMLEKLEQLTQKYILVATPNGFVAQGPEFGNPFQRHLSGWFPNEFAGLGYQVFGTNGTKYLKGYMGEPRIPVRGIASLDNVIVSRLLCTAQLPQHAFSIVAIKDVRGTPARYPSRASQHSTRSWLRTHTTSGPKIDR